MTTSTHEGLSPENEALLLEQLGSAWPFFFYSAGPNTRAKLNALLNAARSRPLPEAVGKEPPGGC